MDDQEREFKSVAGGDITKEKYFKSMSILDYYSHLEFLDIQAKKHDELSPSKKK